MKFCIFINRWNYIIHNHLWELYPTRFLNFPLYGILSSNKTYLISFNYVHCILILKNWFLSHWSYCHLISFKQYLSSSINLPSPFGDGFKRGKQIILELAMLCVRIKERDRDHLTFSLTLILDFLSYNKWVQGVGVAISH